MAIRYGGAGAGGSSVLIGAAALRLPVQVRGAAAGRLADRTDREPRPLTPLRAKGRAGPSPRPSRTVAGLSINAHRLP